MGFPTQWNKNGGGPFVPILSETDPTTGAAPGQWWIVPSTGAAKVRKADGTGWINVAAGGGTPNLAAVLAAGNAASAKITTLTDPAAAQDAATKAYVDGKIWLPASLDFSADNTTQDATTGHHGLLPKLGGGTVNFLRADGTWAAPAAASAGLIAVASFATAATTSSQTIVDIDATNLAPSFVVPSSGNVIVVCSGMLTTATQDTIWGLRTAANAGLGTDQMAVRFSDSNAARRSVSFYLTGLTPGNTVQAKWGHYVDGAGGSTTFFGSPQTATIAVYAAP